MQPQQLGQTLERAFQLHSAGDLEQAESGYQSVLAAAPDHPQALHLYGMLSFQRGNKEAAAEALTKATAIAPENAEAQYHLGVVLQSLNRLEEAVASYRRAIQVAPEHVEAFNNLGAALEDLDRLEDAVSSYRQAISIKPDYPGAYLNIGSIYRRLGRPEEAVTYYRKALEFDPDYTALHFNLGMALSDLAHLDDAIESYRKAIALYPEYAIAHERLGNAIREMGQYENAIECYRAALSIDPRLIDAHINLGVTFNELNRYQDAIAQFHKALEIQPDSAAAQHNLAHSFWKLERYDEARALFETLDTPTCYARQLECLFALDRRDRFYEVQAGTFSGDDYNLRASAINAFAAQQWDTANPDNYCKSPLDFIRVYNALEDTADSAGFLDRLTRSLQQESVIWEPFGKSTVSGFQTPAVLFENPQGPLAELKNMVENAIRRYRTESFPEECGFLDSFPDSYSLNAWYGRLVKGGYRIPHIHPSGWLSGVFYLRCPELGGREEGAIEFSLWGYGYPVLDENYPRHRHHPSNGDIVLFPSSLFHGTIPFQTDEDRLIVAFDVVPDAT